MIRFIASSIALAFTINQHCAAQDDFSYPGGIAELFISKESESIPDVRFGLNEPIIMEYRNRWRVLIGLDLETLPGEYIAYIKSDNTVTPEAYEKVTVKQHIYPFKEYPELDKKVAEQAVLRKYKSYSDLDYNNTRQPSLPLKWPLEGSWSNNFGHKLFDIKRSALHIPNAIVINTTERSIVTAPQTAIVSKIETSSSGLSTIFLDHGRGLYSILSGISDLTVEVGNGIVAGAVIGKLGAEPNRSTNDLVPIPKRLVWQTVINNTYVDPLILTKLEP